MMSEMILNLDSEKPNISNILHYFQRISKIMDKKYEP